MAADSMIDRYVAAFRSNVGLRHDRADLIDEITDHLLCAVEQFQGRGLDRDTAELRALAALGDPRLVASLMTATPSKGTIVSYFLSRYLWIFSAAAVVAWLAAGISSAWGFTEMFGWTPNEYYLSTSLLAVACLATAAVLMGANLRLVGRIDAATAWISGLATVAALICAAGLAWVAALWVPLLVTAVGWTLTRVIRTASGTQRTGVALRAALGTAGVVAIALTALGFVVEARADWAILGLMALFTVTVIAAVVELVVRPGSLAAGNETATS